MKILNFEDNYNDKDDQRSLINAQVQHLHPTPARDHSQEKVWVKLPGNSYQILSNLIKRTSVIVLKMKRWAALAERRGELSTTSLQVEEALHRLITFMVMMMMMMMTMIVMAMIVMMMNFPLPACKQKKPCNAHVFFIHMGESLQNHNCRIISKWGGHSLHSLDKSERAFTVATCSYV